MKQMQFNVILLVPAATDYAAGTRKLLRRSSDSFECAKNPYFNQATQ